MPSKYRPITCLPTTYKLLTGIITDAIENHLTSQNLINQEQKGCTRGTSGTKMQLLTNKSILENCRKNQRNLTTTWIDYKKAYDSVPHSWLKKVLKIYKINPNIIRLIEGAMDRWETSITLNHEKGSIHIPNIKVKRGIFQGDAMSPLLFVMALNPLSNLINNLNRGYRMQARNRNSPQISHLLYMDDLKLYASNQQDAMSQLRTVKDFSNDIRMEFGLDKCATIRLEKGKMRERTNLIAEDVEIRGLEQEESYKYLGIEESDKIEHQKVKDRLSEEYRKRTKLILKSALTNRNKMIAMNTLALPCLSYSFGIINWYQHELNQLDVSTRKMLVAHKSIYKNQCLPRLYLPRREGGLGLSRVDYVHRQTLIQLSEQLKMDPNNISRQIVNHENGKPPATSLTKKANDYLRDGEIPPAPAEANGKQRTNHYKNQYRKAETTKLMEAWHDHKCSGPYKKDILEKEVYSTSLTNEYLTKGFYRPEDERILVAAQDQALRCRWFLKYIEGKEISDLCRLCNKQPETVSHILLGCPILLQRGEYTERHNAVCKLIHHRLCTHYRIPVTSKHHWINSPPTIIENDKAIITYDHEIPTDISIPRCRPNIVVKDKAANTTLIIEVGVPGDIGVVVYESDKEMKYQFLKYEMKRM